MCLHLQRQHLCALYRRAWGFGFLHAALRHTAAPDHNDVRLFPPCCRDTVDKSPVRPAGNVPTAPCGVSWQHSIAVLTRHAHQFMLHGQAWLLI